MTFPSDVTRPITLLLGPSTPRTSEAEGVVRGKTLPGGSKIGGGVERWGGEWGLGDHGDGSIKDIEVGRCCSGPVTEIRQGPSTGPARDGWPTLGMTHTHLDVLTLCRETPWTLCCHSFRLPLAPSRPERSNPPGLWRLERTPKSHFLRRLQVESSVSSKSGSVVILLRVRWTWRTRRGVVSF